MFLKRRKISYKIIGALLLLFSIGAIVFYIPPKNVYIIFTLIIFLTLFLYYLLSFFIDKKKTILWSSFVFIFLLINYLLEFNLINTALLFFLFVALTFLLN